MWASITFRTTRAVSSKLNKIYRAWLMKIRSMGSGKVFRALLTSDVTGCKTWRSLREGNSECYCCFCEINKLGITWYSYIMFLLFWSNTSCFSQFLSRKCKRLRGNRSNKIKQYFDHQITWLLMKFLVLFHLYLKVHDSTTLAILSHDNNLKLVLNLILITEVQ